MKQRLLHIVFPGLLMLILCFSGASAQQASDRYVFAASAGFQTNEVLTLSYSIGEPVVDAWINTDFHLLQGMQQPGDIQEPAKGLQVSIFPNPADDVIFVKMPSRDMLYRSVGIYDMLGSLVRKVELSSGLEHTIDVSDIKAGLYLMEFEGEQQGETVKITHKAIIY